MILFIHGADTFRSRQKLQELKQKFQTDVDPQGYNLSHLIATDSSMADIANAISAAPFMASKRMVVVEMISQQKRSEKEEESLVALMKKMHEDETIVVIFEEGIKKTELKKGLMREIAKTQYTFAFPKWKDAEVAGWMAQELQKAGVIMDRNALGYLSSSVGDDLWRAKTEVHKICMYAQATQKEIDEATIKKLVISPVQDDIFGLVDAISQKRTANALRRLTDQIDSGSHEFAVLSMIARQFRVLQRIKDNATTGIHPYVVKKTSGLANSFPQEKINDSYQALAEFDQYAKRSIVQPREGLIQAVTKICEQ